LGPDCTVFQAEIYAVKKAAEWMVNVATFSNIIIRFFIDSQAVICALMSNSTTSQLVFDTMALLNELGHDNTVSLNWVKAHVGHAGNEEADRLAKLGALTPDTNAQVVGLSGKASRKIVLNLMHERWTAEWQARKDCRQSKHFLSGVDKQKAIRILKLCDRPMLSGLVQFITGHNFLKRHEFQVINKSKEIQEGSCRFCTALRWESIEHIFGECDKFSLRRLEVFGSHQLFQPFQWQPNQIFSFLRGTDLEELFIPGLSSTGDEEEDNT